MYMYCLSLIKKTEENLNDHLQKINNRGKLIFEYLKILVMASSLRPHTGYQ